MKRALLSFLLLTIFGTCAYAGEPLWKVTQSTSNPAQAEAELSGKFTVFEDTPATKGVGFQVVGSSIETCAYANINKVAVSTITGQGGSGVVINAPLVVSSNTIVNGNHTVNGDASVNGNISTTGTVDGRDVSTDGSRLDAVIESTSSFVRKDGDTMTGPLIGTEVTGDTVTVTTYLDALATYSIKFYVGEVYISSTSFPAFSGLAYFNKSSMTITQCRVYCEYTSTVSATQTEWDICYSSSTSGASTSRTWSSIFTSTIPWIAPDSLYSNWFVPDVTNVGQSWAIAPRVLSIPNSGDLPIIYIEVVVRRKLND